ncbi:ADP-ribosylglycohydrolase family protein [Luteipulveratus mongoliensis]|uniref:ADP-ribosylglycohydrolase n=1 Tax=Luteipulveratus mongoliensis TaxID=571913 RepID=A0A0K1JKE5_9MICO|nr:ADP-ribosylglycohydrolase family protein [Luteipulveratus mongoliensis]AKU17187.1 hypothetical protein VV02_17195 [Luteipulveratus mongoliensis]
MPDGDVPDRAYGALAGLAVGDALGMPTQSFTRAEIQARFGRLTTLVDAPPDQPIAPDVPAGQVTDDTEQMLLLAAELVEGHGHADPARWAGALDAWEQDMTARGSRDLLGPSTRRAIDLIRAGIDPAEAGASGTTNGAAMRIAPLGLALAWGESSAQHLAFVERVAQTCLPTHHTGVAIAGAAAVAAAISCALDGGAYDDLVAAALAAARLGERCGTSVPGPSVAGRLEWVLGSRTERSGDALDDWLYDVVGTTVATTESVPTAFALLEDALSDPRAGLSRAASLGGDTDTIAAILGAITGARLGRSGLPQDWCETVERVNGLDLAAVAGRLLSLREVS